ncbi:MAG: polyphenol oxidase family protein, partial [Pseudomonadota bacterium]
AGWRGAIDGVIGSCLNAMGRLGADPARIIAAIGPHIGWSHYQVDSGFRVRFLQQSQDHDQFFQIDLHCKDRFLFDLGGYVAGELRANGVRHIERVPGDSFADHKLFFSYRRSVKQAESDYGRQLSVIACQP